MSNRIEVLILEDDPRDAELIMATLRSAGFEARCRVADRESAFLEHLDERVDVILADYSLPQYDAARALRAVQERGLDVPFIVVSGVIGEENGVEMMKQGAADYLMKDRLGRLGGAISHALEQRRLRLAKREMEAQLRASEERFRLLVGGVRDYAIAMLDPMGRVASWNMGADRIFGYQAHEIVGRYYSCFFPDEDAQAEKPTTHLRLALEKGEYEVEGWLVRKDGSRFWGNAIISVPRTETGLLQGYALIVRDATERKRTHEALQGQARVLDEMVEGICVSDNEGHILFTNVALDQMFGFQRGELFGRHVGMLHNYPPAENQALLASIKDDLARAGCWHGELRHRRKDGSLFVTDGRIELLPLSGQMLWVLVPRMLTPNASSASSDHPDSYASSLSGSRKQAILVVEDEPVVRELSSLVLREIGYEVLEAANGREAVAVFQRHSAVPIAIVISDVVMPRMGGLELADWVRQHHPRCKILFISGYTDTGAENEGSLAGAPFLQKPFTAATLARKVKEVLGG